VGGRSGKGWQEVVDLASEVALEAADEQHRITPSEIVGIDVQLAQALSQ
jgi:hypothetical protein